MRSNAMKGIGIDAVEIERFRKMLERRPNMRARLFTEDELQSLASQSDDAASLAARFAVREATMKALGVFLKATTVNRNGCWSLQRANQRNIT